MPPKPKDKFSAFCAYNAALRQPAGSKQIECLINSEGGEAIVEIADQGCGIEESLRDRIFERGVTSSDSGDHGIGLWLVRSYVEQAGTNDAATLVNGEYSLANVLAVRDKRLAATIDPVLAFSSMFQPIRKIRCWQPH